MAVRLIICWAVMFVSDFTIVCAQEIQYGTGNWNRQELGNHRIVINVNEDIDAVSVHVPWRRQDDPAKKSVIMIDAATGKRITNMIQVSANREYADFIFQPATGKGIYYLYYMPYQTTGSSYFPNTVYLSSTDQSDSRWITDNNISDRKNVGHLSHATVLRFESINEFNSFYPMEVIATTKEVQDLQLKKNGNDFSVFAEDRKYPIRMTTDIPQRWINDKRNNQFSGTAMRGEFYVYQLGIYASPAELHHLQLHFSDLETAGGGRISSSSIRCFNLKGKDWLGKPFIKEVSVKAGEVQALWIGIDIATTAAPGNYKGTVKINADDGKSATIEVSIKISDQLVKNRGYDDLFRMARLNWLDSDIGLDDNVFKPFHAVEVYQQTVSILGRTLRIGKYGLPEKITSSFTGSNDEINGETKDILAQPVQLIAIAAGKEISWRNEKTRIVQKSSGAVSWTNRRINPNAIIQLHAKMECDGYINYNVTLTATSDIALDDVRLLIPYAKPVALYMMGLGFKSGNRPKKWNWKWEKDKANNMVWIGDVNAGLQCKLKNETPDWSLYNFDKTGPYRDWSNEGQGGCELSEEEDSYLFKAFTGKKTLKRGDVMFLNFGLLITPLKKVDNKHFNERYYQADPPVAKWMPEAVGKGANVMNIHQGNIMNPYINYPFIATDTLINYVAVAKSKGIRSKLYYTVRELSNYTPEIWALRSLGDEIFTPGLGAQLADQFADDGAGGNLYSTGGSWLTEHLQTNYDAAWHSPIGGGDWDMAIRTQGLSRWHNYYLEGLQYLVKNTGIRGIYLDGAGYDREIMKRVRKVLDNTADSCLIDFHSGNNFQPAYGLSSTANTYMELFPCVNSLWLGEMFDYNETPEYWLVEFSGIPFGLFGEMLQGCGNPYRGMVYGMTSRLGWGCDPSALWKVWDSFGIADAKMIGYWDEKLPVSSNRKEIRVTAYQKKDKLLIAYASWGKQDMEIEIKVNWKALGMDPGKVRISVPGVPGFQQQQDHVEMEKIHVPAGKGGMIIIENEG